MGVDMLLEAMDHLDLRQNRICNEGAALLAMALAKSTLPSLTRLFIWNCAIWDGGFITLLSPCSRREDFVAISQLAKQLFQWMNLLAPVESLPENKVLQRIGST
jgi:hypothetical protein